MSIEKDILLKSETSAPAVVLTKRERFALAAMEGMISNPTLTTGDTAIDLRLAVRAADGLIAALNLSNEALYQIETKEPNGNLDLLEDLEYKNE